MSSSESGGLEDLSDYKRYGRQMIISGFGLPAQSKLQKASVLVVGAGGLGCPALQYLCSAGVGHLGIVDHDIVELSNLQRQILHSEETLGIPKVESAARNLRRSNSRVRISTYNEPLTASNAENILSSYDVILDCTDNAPARYLLSDVCVRLTLPLVSGAAQRLDGQLCTYNLPLNETALDDEGAQQRGPCYRCLFPKPPAPEMAGSCEETGILGAVTGLIGSLQALEAIKLITGLHDRKPTLLIYSALGFPQFRHVKLRSRKKTCPACGVEGNKIGEISSTDYITFCGGPRPDWVVRGLESQNDGRRIGPKELRRIMREKERAIRIIDVRSPVEFGICSLEDSQNVPLAEVVASPQSFRPSSDSADCHNNVPLMVFVCRLGNDSQIAADAVRESLSQDSSQSIVDLVGGLRGWANEVDVLFPVY